MRTAPGAPSVLWQPSAERAQRSTLGRYMRSLQTGSGLTFDDDESLWRWSVSELEQFRPSIWELGELRASAPYARAGM